MPGIVNPCGHLEEKKKRNPSAAASNIIRVLIREFF
jgi:hypothetical protein